MPRDNDQDGTPQGVFGAELRYYRERAGLSQTELAALVNVSHDVISKIETGERPPAEGLPRTAGRRAGTGHARRPDPAMGQPPQGPAPPGHPRLVPAVDSL